MAASNSVGFTEEDLLGIPEIDDQHENIFSMLAKIDTVGNDLYTPLDDEEVDDLLDILYDTRDQLMHHFDREEALMEEVEYPDIEEQQDAHAKFIVDLGRMEGELMNGSAMPPIKIRNFLHEWCREHIDSMDKKFGIFYNNTKK